MKKIIIITIFIIAIVSCLVNSAYAITLFEDDFSSSSGWHYSMYSYSTLNYGTIYNPEKHTDMTISDNTLSVANGFAHKTFTNVNSGILEISYEAKKHEAIGQTIIGGTGGKNVAGVYLSGLNINANHEYGQASLNGTLITKLPRRGVDDWHKYVIKADMDKCTATVTVDGVKTEEFPLRTPDTDAIRITFRDISVRNLKAERYYELEFSDETGKVNHIYDSGDITLAVNDEAAEGELIAAVYKAGKLISVKKSAENFVTVTAADGDEIKGFYFRNETLIPLTINTSEVSSAEETKALRLLHDFENQNPESDFDLTSLKNKEFLELPDIVLYERATPDDTKTFQNSNTKKNTYKEATWYSGGTKAEKSEQLLDLAAEATGTYPSGYTVSLKDQPLYSLLTGNIEAAEKAILSKSGYTFTDHTQYYLYFKYGDMLSDEVRAHLKKVIYDECFNQAQGFKWYTASVGPSVNSHHNQSYDGLVRGLMFAYAYIDDEEYKEQAAEVLSVCDDMVDKMVASTAASGYGIGDWSSPCYSAMIWSDLITLSDLLPAGDIKTKIDLLLNRVDAEVAALYHSGTSNIAGPYARSGFDLASGLNIRQNFPLMLYALTDRKNFYKNDEAIDRMFFYPLLAAYDHKIPKYLESIAFDKDYPFESKVTKIRNATKDEYLIDAGYQSQHKDSVRQAEENTSYMTDSYSLGTAPDTVWYIPGLRGQDSAFLARWKRKDEIKSLHDTPILTSYYRYNMGHEASDSVFVPIEHGLSATAQHENKAIVYSYPGKVADEKFEEGEKLAAYKNNIYNMGCSLFISHPEDTKIYYEDELIAGEEIIAEKDGMELRAKLQKLPYTAENSDGTIYLEDKRIYAAVIPLNTGGIEFRDVSFDSGNGGIIIPAYSINLYNEYNDEAKWYTYDERTAMRNGYIFEIAEKTEYESLEAFKEHIRETSFIQNEENGIWKTEYTSGSDTLSLSFDTENLYVTERKINGEAQKNVFYNVYDGETCLYPTQAKDGYYTWNKSSVYKENPDMFVSDNLIQSQRTEIKIGDCVLKNPGEAMVYVVYSPKTKTYVVGDLTAGEHSFTLKTPYGDVWIENLDVGYMMYDGNTQEIKVIKTEADADSDEGMPTDEIDEDFNDWDSMSDYSEHGWGITTSNLGGERYKLYSDEENGNKYIGLANAGGIKKTFSAPITGKAELSYDIMYQENSADSYGIVKFEGTDINGNEVIMPGMYNFSPYDTFWNGRVQVRGLDNLQLDTKIILDKGEFTTLKFIIDVENDEVEVYKISDGTEVYGGILKLSSDSDLASITSIAFMKSKSDYLYFDNIRFNIFD